MPLLNDVSTFTIKVSDSFCEYEYKLKLTDKYSIAEIAENIAWVLGATKDEGKLIRSAFDEQKET